MIDMMLATLLWATAPADTTITLRDVTVTGQQRRDYQMRTSQSEIQIGH